MPKTYPEKGTGAKADRRELQRLLKAIQPGDVVTVTRIDRLARSTFDLFGIVKRIVDAADNSGPWRSRGPQLDQHRAVDAGCTADRTLPPRRTTQSRGLRPAMAGAISRPIAPSGGRLKQPWPCLSLHVAAESRQHVFNLARGQGARRSATLEGVRRTTSSKPI